MVVIRGVDIEYDVAGTGPDVVWGHGLTSSMASEDDLGLFDWSALRSSHRLVRYDARGHGASGSTLEPDDYSWRQLAVDQLMLADHLGIGSYVAGGASMGCATALARCRTGTGTDPWSPARHPADRMGDSGRSGRHVPHDGRPGRGGRSRHVARRRRGYDRYPTRSRTIRVWSDRFPELLATVDPVRLARVFRGAVTADLPEPDAIAAIDVPALILAWTGDPGHPASTAARLQELTCPTPSWRSRRALSDWLRGPTARAARFLDRF